MRSIELFSSRRTHREDIIKNFFIPNKTDNPNAARNCPACRKHVDNKADAIDHSQKCLELIRAQQEWIKGRRNEEPLPTSHSNGTVSHEASAESSDGGAKSRPSCSVCGKVFKVRL